MVLQLVERYDFYKNEYSALERLQEKFRKPELKNYNFFGRLIFVTENLDSLIKEWQSSLNGNVNKAPKSWRGQSDYLGHVVNTIDSDFRKSLNRHYPFYVNVGNIPRNSMIGRSIFSYHNIDLNLGNVI